MRGYMKLFQELFTKMFDDFDDVNSDGNVVTKYDWDDVINEYIPNIPQHGLLYPCVPSSIYSSNTTTTPASFYLLLIPPSNYNLDKIYPPH